MISQEIIRFCGNWINKANNYNVEVLQDVFDKFFTLYVVYNRLYVETTFRMSNRGEINIQNRNSFPDSKAAKSYVVQYLTSRKINTEFTNDKNCIEAIERMKDIIRNTEFNIKLNMVSGESDRVKDLELLKKLEGNNIDSKIRAIIDFIYSVRCNVFHGQKMFQQNQINVLKPVIVILTKINQLLFNQLIEEDNLNLNLETSNNA